MDKLLIALLGLSLAALIGLMFAWFIIGMPDFSRAPAM